MKVFMEAMVEEAQISQQIVLVACVSTGGANELGKLGVTKVTKALGYE